MIRKILAVALLLIAWPVWVWGACSPSGSDWVCTAGTTAAQLQTCLQGADAGDTITITGNITLSSTVEFYRGVNIVGSGTPTITSTQTAFYWIPNATAQAAHDTLSISGLILDGNNSGMGGAGIIRVYNASSGANHVNLVIQENTLKNMIVATYTPRAIYLTGTIYGVIAKNIFDRVAVLIGAYGSVGGTLCDGYAQWNSLDQAYGTAENLYFEDNLIQFASSISGYIGWIETGQGGRLVARYNTYDYSNINDGDEIWDAHGLQGTSGNCQQYSTMVTEYYGNKIIDAVSMNRWQAHRGGWMVMFNNTFTGTTNGGGLLTLGITEYRCEDCAGCGLGTGQNPHNSYFWRNFSNGTEDPVTWYDPGSGYGCATKSTANVDYWNFNASWDPGEALTSGVACGTLANRPTTCTSGVGYWATNQSCSDVSAVVGANGIGGLTRSSDISGTLYKCGSSNSWSAIFTPYEYPHPLRSDEGDTTAPTITTASVTGSTVTVNFSETVNTTGYDAGDFNLDCSTSGSNISLSSPSGTGSSRTFTAATAIVYGETCNLDYVGSTDDIEDSAGNDLVAVNDIAVSNYTGGDETDPVVTADDTTVETSSSSVSLEGDASDASGIVSVAYINDRGGSGACTGTTAWTCNVATLYNGINVITITATDGANPANTGTDTVTVTYAPNVTHGTTLNTLNNGNEPQDLYFTLASSGSYRVIGSVNVADTGSNSFYIRDDADPGTDNYYVWDLDVTTGYEDQYVAWRATEAPEIDPVVFSWSAGVHYLAINPRETGTLIQSIEFESNAPPSANGCTIQGGNYPK